MEIMLICLGITYFFGYEILYKTLEENKLLGGKKKLSEVQDRKNGKERSLL